MDDFESVEAGFAASFHAALAILEQCRIIDSPSDKNVAPLVVVTVTGFNSPLRELLHAAGLKLGASRKANPTLVATRSRWRWWWRS